MRGRSKHLCGLVAVIALVLLACRPGRSSRGKAVERKTFEAIEVAANAKHTCLLLKSGPPRCFGADDTRDPPMTAAPTEPLRRLRTGRRFACALRQQGSTLACWGDCNATGRCAAPAGAFEDFSLGDDGGGCAWSNAASPRVECWGDPRSRFPAPAELDTLALKQLVIGANWAVALKTDGTLIPWGRGAVVSDPRLTAAVAGRHAFRSIGGRGALLCLVDTAGGRSCIAHHKNQEPPVVTGSVLRIDAASPRGAIPACVLVEHAGSRSVRCTPTNKGHHITGLTGNIVDMAVGDDHVCVLRAGNQVQCVGDNLFGRVTGRSLFKATDWP
mgnify:CR=1 FL=1